MRTLLKIIFVFFFLSLLIVRPPSSYAWHDHGYVGVHIGVWPGYYYGYPYYPYNYPYYDPYYAAAPYYPEYAVVASGYQPVVVNGTTYYENNGAYYLYTQNGYQAVAAPAGAPVTTSTPGVEVGQVSAASTPGVGMVESADDAITINIPNDKGGYNAVLLKRSGQGWVGPQGEFYAEFPKVSQLKAMYGK